MARPKEFDPDKALDRAMDLFWCKGYEATSLQDLVDSLGVNRQSLYDTFGDKHELFLAAVDQYYRKRILGLLSLLDKPGSGLEAIRNVFRLIVDEGCTSHGWRGCLVTNCRVELVPHDKEVAAKVEMIHGEIEEGFYRALVRAKKAGELNSQHFPRVLARFLTGFMMGLSVMMKEKTPRAEVQDMIEVALGAL